MIILDLQNVSLVRNNFRLNCPNFSLIAGERLYISGPSASGKSTLLNAIKNKQFISTGSIQSLNTAEIELIQDSNNFKDRAGRSDFYYQQRFDAAFADDSPTVAEEIGNSELAASLLREFGIDHLLNLHLIKLSNGENKKLQIVKALLKKPGLLLLDNPFAGLDANSIRTLLNLFDQLKSKKISVIIACKPSLIPDNHEKVLLLDTLRLHNHYKNPGQKNIDIKLAEKNSHNKNNLLVELKNINVRYDNRVILKNFSWKIYQTEKWLLKGSNGAGKSTILSLINADNPQVYSNEVFIFGKKRGSGESIWDIKKRIGFFSPELQICFDLNMTAENALCSAFSTSTDYKNKISADQQLKVDRMLDRLGITANSYLYNLTFSQKRLVLIGRAIIKDPELIILDEPCQNLDPQQINFVKSMVDDLPKKSTLIYVTHSEEEVPETINAVLEIKDGKVVSNSADFYS